MFKVFYTIFLLGSLLLFSCNNRSEISSEFNCSSSKLKNLEKVTDVKELFNIHLPKNWKINLYQDKSQSSIFAADTIKELTETTLLDITFIKNKINFNEDFLLKQEQENLPRKLIKTTSVSNFQNKQIDISNLSEGIYITNFYANNVHIASKRFVKN